MERLYTVLRNVGMVTFIALASLALPRLAQAGGVHVSIGVGLPLPVVVAPPIVVAPAPVVVYPAPVVVAQPPVLVAAPQVIERYPRYPYKHWRRHPWKHRHHDDD